MRIKNGSITASCGHVLADDEGTGIPVLHKGESLDIPHGFTAAVVYATFCKKCEAEWRAEGLLFADETEADAWLDAQPVPSAS